MTAENTNEKRHFQRILYNAGAKLSSDAMEMSCKVLDISLKGCLLAFETPWTENADQTFYLNLELSEESSIKMTLKYSHGSELQAGFQCQQIDIDSMTNLRRLVELNLGDIALLNRDLSALIDR